MKTQNKQNGLIRIPLMLTDLRSNGLIDLSTSSVVSVKVWRLVDLAASALAEAERWRPC